MTDAVVAEVATEVLADPETRSAALMLTVLAAGRAFTQWMCGYGFHVWIDWEYDDGTLTTECDVCGEKMETPR